MIGPDPTFIAFLVGAVTAVCGFLAWLIKDVIADVRKQRDMALAGWTTQTEITNKLADALHERNTLDEQMIVLLKGDR